MKSIIRKFLSLSLAVVLAAAPLNAFASDALGDDLASSSVEVNERTELNAGTFWSNTYSDLRQENYVVYSPNSRVQAHRERRRLHDPAYNGLDRREKARSARLPRGRGHQRRLLRHGDGHPAWQHDDRGRAAQRLEPSITPSASATTAAR